MPVTVETYFNRLAKVLLDDLPDAGGDGSPKGGQWAAVQVQRLLNLGA